MKVTHVAGGCVAFLGIVGASQASVLRVPESYSSVLAAADAAVAGDSVLVGPGTWTHREVRTVVVLGSPLQIESTVFLKPGVTVIGSMGADQTTLDGGEETSHLVVTVVHAQPGGEPARLRGLTLTGGGEGVSASGPSPLEIYECRIVQNRRQGIASREATLVLSECYIAENELGVDATSLRSAIWGIDISLTCTNGVFERNVGPAIRLLDNGLGLAGPVLLLDCLFRDNKRRAVDLRGLDSPVTIERCAFLRNTSPVEDGAVGAGGAIVLSSILGSVRFCTFAYDSAGGSGGGLVVVGSSVVVENNTFYRCHAGFAGGAMALNGTDAGTHHNIVTECTGPRSSFRVTAVPHPTTGCNLFYMNESPAYDGIFQAPGDYFHRDPQFCDAPNLDFSLRSSSPAAPGFVPCGQRGAHGVMCGPVSIESKSWGGIKSLYR